MARAMLFCVMLALVALAASHDVEAGKRKWTAAANAPDAVHEHKHDHDHHHGHAHADDHDHHDCGHAHDEAHHEHKHAHEDEVQHDHKHAHGHAHHDRDHAHGHAHHDHDHGHDHDHAHHDHDHDHDEPKSPGANLSWETWMYAMLSTGFISAVPAFILIFLPVEPNSPSSRSLLKILLSFASGGLLGDAFLHLIPHANGHDHGDHHDHHDHGHDHGHAHDHSEDLKKGLCILAGIIAFLVIEKTVRGIKGGHGHSHGAPPAPVAKPAKAATPAKAGQVADPAKAVAIPMKVAGYLNLAADFAHNFTDGLAIGASFATSSTLATTTVFTILLHEVPHEVGDFAILVQSGCSKRKAILLQLTTAIGAMLGTFVGLLSGELGGLTPFILLFTAGGFIYIATVSVLPELLEDSSLKQSVLELLAMMAGISTMVGIVFLE